MSEWFINQNRTSFQKRFFPESTRSMWSDWRWQLRHRFRNPAALARVLRLSDSERTALDHVTNGPPWAITPYYAALMNPDDPSHPLRRTLVPTLAENIPTPGESSDPLDETTATVAPNLIRRHEDRVVLLATDLCAGYCRYCTRSRLVGNGVRTDWQPALAYIATHPEIRDVLISGGDPLLLATRRLERLLTSLRAIPHVELIRIGSRMPLLVPMRITRKLVAMLKRHHPLGLSLHATHPDELTPEAGQALERLADAGILLAGQTVLLAGINDDLETLRTLMRGLVRHRVRPYYLYQCDPISGSGHFRVPVSRGLILMEGLVGHLSGYAVPRYVIDAPGGGGKIPIASATLVGREGNDLLIRNHLGRICRYPDPELRGEPPC
ncbi:L-lysine 2,3-aminomutase [Candidatus Magnetaquicoccaceae bacterium FCR-1]|uniref:L-lysine 2,3-aminomutase n=1 Tax=Candidatus Magnetaquiglobus chichijimensis TaxID=3141448 RepID=A0ABQ0C6K5_9PROT